MNKQLQELIIKYQNDTDNNNIVKNKKNIVEYYVKNFDERDTIQSELLKFFKEDKKTEQPNWSLFFNFDSSFCQKIILLEEKKIAEENFIFFQEMKYKEDFLDFILQFMHISVNKDMENKAILSPQIEQNWLDVFKNIPHFKDHWLLLKIDKKLEQQKFLQEFSNLKDETKDTIQTLEIKVPIDIQINGNSIDKKDYESIDETIEYHKFMKNRIEIFNDFNLQSYMDIPQCNSITMDIEGFNYIFRVEMNDSFDSEEFKEALFGQLTDGFGSNLYQQPLLIKDKVYYFDFDVKNSSELEEVFSFKKKLKFK